MAAAAVTMAAEEVMSDFKQLYDAIAAGDVEKSKQLAGLMANTNREAQGGIDKSKMEPYFNLAVTVEDSVATEAVLRLRVKSSYSIFDLKYLLMFLYKFPVQTQRWIIGQQVAPDNRTLASLKVTQPGHRVFVYIKRTRTFPNQETFEEFRTNYIKDNLRTAQHHERVASGPPPPVTGLPNAASYLRNIPLQATVTPENTVMYPCPAPRLNGRPAHGYPQINENSPRTTPRAGIETTRLQGQVHAQQDPTEFLPEFLPAAYQRLRTHPGVGAGAAAGVGAYGDNIIGDDGQNSGDGGGISMGTVGRDGQGVDDLRIGDLLMEDTPVRDEGGSIMPARYPPIVNVGNLRGVGGGAPLQQPPIRQPPEQFVDWGQYREAGAIDPDGSLGLTGPFSIGTDSDIPEVPKNWTCPQCTLENLPESKRCIACEGVRPQDRTGLVDGVDRGEELRDSPEERNQNGGEEAGADEAEGWRCAGCTLINEPWRPGCSVCGHEPPPEHTLQLREDSTPEELARVQKEAYVSQIKRESLRKQQELAEKLQETNRVKWELETKRRAIETEERRLRSYEEFVQVVSKEGVIPNREPFSCAICMSDIEPGEGVTLRECLHNFCRECLAGTVEHCEESQVQCPYVDENYKCEDALLHMEIKELVSDEVFQTYLRRGLQTAESQAGNSYHCQTEDCVGWCMYEDDVNFFKCPVCSKKNCLTCKAIHENQNCKEYQEDLKTRANNDISAKATQDQLMAMINSGEAMHCPQCKIVVTKKSGCDWLRCSVCKTEICWVRKMARWGPAGQGDTSGGCGCRVNGQLCDPNCLNCH